MNRFIKFRNRNDAGKQLAAALKKYINKNVIVYALPRGGVVVAHEIASYLHVQLDLIITRKIGHPQTPEYAIGAIAENGHTIFNEQEIEIISTDWIEQKISEEQAEAKRRREIYVGGREPYSAKGKIAILVDDGIATGLTLRVGIIELKHQHPKKIVVALPVISSHMANIIRKEVDELVAVYIVEYDEGPVGSWYDEFNPVSDNEVIQILQQH